MRDGADRVRLLDAALEHVGQTYHKVLQVRQKRAPLKVHGICNRRERPRRQQLDRGICVPRRLLQQLHKKRISDGTRRLVHKFAPFIQQPHNAATYNDPYSIRVHGRLGNQSIMDSARHAHVRIRIRIVPPQRIELVAAQARGVVYDLAGQDAIQREGPLRGSLKLHPHIVRHSRYLGRGTFARAERVP